MNETKEQAPKFLRVTEVASLLDCSESHAYKIMQTLNKELEAKGKITVKGRIRLHLICPANMYCTLLVLS